MGSKAFAFPGKLFSLHQLWDPVLSMQAPPYTHLLSQRMPPTHFGKKRFWNEMGGQEGAGLPLSLRENSAQLSNYWRLGLWEWDGSHTAAPTPASPGARPAWD